MIGRNTSCSSKRNRLVGSCINTLVSSTNSFVSDLPESERALRLVTGGSSAFSSNAALLLEGFNKIEHLLHMTGNLDAAPLAPDDTLAVDDEGAALNAAHLFAIHVLHL